MRTMFALLALAMVALFATMGSVSTSVAATKLAMTEGHSQGCDLRFGSVDTGNKGYLTEEDLRFADFGASMNDSHGKIASKFATMDENGDGKVTPQEYCAFRAPLGPAGY